jgi:hypothetical protein
MRHAEIEIINANFTNMEDVKEIIGAVMVV